MKVMQYLVIAMSLLAATAYAQGDGAQPSATAESTAQNGSAPAEHKFGRADVEKRKDKKDECIGPVSFCNIYFGS